MQHPHVVECDLSTPERFAVLGAHRFRSNNDSTLLTEAAIVVVLMPRIVCACETFRGAAWVPDQVTQADDFRIGGGAVEEQLGRTSRSEFQGEPHICVVRPDTGNERGRLSVASSLGVGHGWVLQDH